MGLNNDACRPPLLSSTTPSSRLSTTVLRMWLMRRFRLCLSRTQQVHLLPVATPLHHLRLFLERTILGRLTTRRLLSPREQELFLKTKSIRIFMFPLNRSCRLLRRTRLYIVHLMFLKTQMCPLLLLNHHWQKDLPRLPHYP